LRVSGLCKHGYTNQVKMSASEISNTKKGSPRSKQFNFIGDKKDPDYRIKQVIWLYFFLLIFEGALRKWILPFAAGPILIIRDPVALYLIILANRRGMIYSGYAKCLIIIGCISLVTTMITGHRNIAVALYGARILIIHFPVVFIIGRFFNADDVRRIGKATLLIAIPMIVLVIMQFFSPQSAFVNRGVGGDESGAGFNGAMGFFRPPGTFSFTNGNTLFYSFLAPFVFYFWLSFKNINKWILIAATLALLAAVPLSISRALFFSIIVTAVFTIIAVSRKPSYFSKILGASIGIMVLFMLLSQTAMFQTATGAFTARLEGANTSEGGVEGVVFGRYFGGMIRSVAGAADQPFFGYGIGLGTALGGQTFHIQTPEGEWPTIIWENGLVMGFIILIVRLSFSFEMLTKSYVKLAKGDLLPWLLLSFFLTNMPQAQWKQPTALGFCMMIGGLQLAALRTPKKLKKAVVKPLAVPQT
jgi:hypothetical protein